MKKNLSILILFLFPIIYLQAQSWCGNSFMVVNDVWYTGSNSYVHTGGYFNAANLGTLSESITLGGELQVYPYTNDTETMYYRIDDNTFNAVALALSGSDGNNSKHYGATSVSLSGLTAGTHTIEIYFQAGSVYDSNSGGNYKATFIIPDNTTDASRQLVTTSVDFPTAAQPLDLIFDLSQGDAAMKYISTDSVLYVHTGVITDKSSSDSDWKYSTTWLDNSSAYQLTSLGDYKWKFSISSSLRTFYGVPNTDSIYSLAFVIRNSTGTQTAKDEESKDIFVKVYPSGLQVKMKNLSDQNLIGKDSTLQITAVSSQKSLLTLYLDNEVLQSGNDTTVVSLDKTFSTSGNYWLIAEASSGTVTVRDSVWLVVEKDVETLAMPSNTRAGINVQNDSTVTLVLYAPEKSNVYVIGDFNDWKISNDYQLKQDGDNWWITLKGLISGQEYAFQYLVDGTIRIADPYTDKVLDPWNDSGIPSSVYPDLKAYPTGKTTGIVSVLETGQTAYEWTASDFTHVERNKLVIYELLVRDFVSEHSFDAVKAKLDYLHTLGINAIELMPVNEFEGNSSWGYNPSFYFAVDKYYGTKNAFKAFIDECHKRQISVIMDLVLNHSYGQSPFVQLYWDSANSCPSSNNPWYNVTSPNTSYSWGYDFNHESTQTQALVDSINSYWMSEYKIDGFRYDFTKGFTNTSGDGYAYDASRIAILERMAAQIWNRNPNAYVICEHLTDNSEETVLANDGILLWGNMNYSYCEALMGWTSTSDLSWGVYSNRGWTYQNLVAYMESHDEERTMYKALTYGNESGTYSVKDLPTALERAKALAAFNILQPGPKMIWQFGELGYDYSINTGSDGVTISDDNRTAEKPIRWDYYEEANRKALYDVYSTLIAYKNQYSVFSGTDVTYSIGATAAKSIVWRSDEMNAFLVENFGVTSTSVTAELPKTGVWYDVFNNESSTFTSTSYAQTLAPGEFRLYVDQAVASLTKQMQANETELALLSGNNIINQSNSPLHVHIYDLSGQEIASADIDNNLDISFLSSGIYLAKLQTENKTSILKIYRK